jgi:hypothetical protein
MVALGALGYVDASELSEWGSRLYYGPPPRLLELVGKPGCTATLGQEYLRTHAQEAHIGILQDLILPGVDAVHASPADLRAAFRQRVQVELEADQFVEVKGWLLARSEGRLFALDALWKAHQGA